MTTAATVIAKALSHIKVRAAGEAVGGDDAEDARGALNTMLDAWRLESLFAYATTTITATLAADTQTLNVGPAQTIAADPRPIRFEAGCFYTVGGLDYPLRPVTEAEFNAIALKATSALGPEVFFYRPGFTTGTISFYPRASTSVTLSMIALVQVAEFADLTTEYNLAPGYKRAIEWSLGEEMAGMFEVPLTLLDFVARQAKNARNALRRVDHTVPQLEVCTVGESRYAAFVKG